jgi:tetratricopeptide (TPR) repeat protein
MTKVALAFLGLAAVLALPATAPAQNDNTAIAVNEAVLRQANTIVLRQQLTAARRAQQSGDVVGAAKLYQQSTELAQKIGSGIDVEKTQAINGLLQTRLTIAREDQLHGDYRDANNQIQQVLNADAKNAQALAFKKQNDALIAANKGQIPDAATAEQVPQIAAQKTDAGTLVRDGQLLYEMGKFDEAEAKLNQALALDPDSASAFYYMNLIQQSKFQRESLQHTVDTQKRMAQVEKQWVLPTSKVTNPSQPNPYATNNLIYTGSGRQSIISKLDRIHLDNFTTGDGIPLSEVLRNLSEQAKLRDPDKKGINFLINPNADQSGQPVAAAATTGIGGGIGGGFGLPAGGAPGAAAPNIDPATGLPVAAPAAQGNSENADVGSFIIKIPSLVDVRLADVLDAIVLVADHPIKYSVQDFAVVFQAKGQETTPLFSRTFKVDPNTFYSGLESVSAQSFGSTGGSTGNGSSGGSSGGGGNSGGGNNNNNNGAVVGVVNAFAGAGGLRSSGNGGNGGGGGGGGGNSQGAVNPLTAGAGGGGGGNIGANGGLNFVTQIGLAATPSEVARAFFTALGVNLVSPPGKSVFFNDRLGLLFVKATEQDLDTIERAIQALNEVAPQVHIKARFIEVEQDDNKALGFDWYLGQFNANGSGSIVASGGTSPSLNVPVSAANPLGAFPGNTAASVVPGSLTDQMVTSGLRNTPYTLGTITGILTDPNFRVAIHALEQRSGYESLAEPEVTTISGRQTQMRATKLISVITSVGYQQGTSTTTTTGTTGQ